MLNNEPSSLINDYKLNLLFVTFGIKVAKINKIKDLFHK